MKRIEKILVAVLLPLAHPAATPAATIGLNFVRGAGADVVNVQNAVANSLAAADLAGAAAYAQTNWNNLGYRGTNIVLVDSTGASSGVTVNWDSGNAWSQSGGGTPTTQGTPDGNLMNSYLDSNGSANTTFNANLWANSNNNKPLVHFSGLSAWLASQGASYYDVVIYSDGDDAGGRVGEFWTVDANSDPTALVLGSDQVTHTFICDRTNFTTTLAYAQVPNIIQSGLNARFGNFAGNFTAFDSLTANSFLIRDAEFATRCVINAIQIIPRATPIPATIAPLPNPEVFSNATVQLRAQVGGRIAQTYQWQKNGSNLSDGGNIAGSTTANLTVSNVAAADVASYALVVTSPVGSVTSAPAALSIAVPVADSYPEKIVTNGPYAYWRFNEAGDPSTNYTIALDYAGSFHGTYGSLAQNGFNAIAGPRPSDWPGFGSGNTAMQCTTNGRPSWVSAPPLNLNTNTVTFCAWIYPYTAQNGFTALIAERNGNDVASFGYGGNNNLGYTWNSNNAATFNFVSGLVPLTNAWSFVALTISPSNAILYLYNTNGQLSATNSITHSNEAWSGLTFIGADAQASTGNPQGRSFNGILDELAIFNRTLPPTEIYNLYKKGLGLSAIGPTIPTQPTSLALFAGRPATFRVVGSGDPPLTYQWRTNGVNLANGGTVSGANTPTLSISGVALSDAANYDVVVANIVGPVTSSVATLSVVISNSAPTPYEAKLRLANPLSYWRMNETNGSPYAYDYWGGITATNESLQALGVAGPQPPDFSGLESTNTAGQYDGLTSDTATSVSLMNNRSQFTIFGWFNAAGTIGQRVGLFGQNDVCEFGFHGLGPDGLAQVGIWTPRGAAFLNQSNIAANVWYLVAAVGDGTNVSLTLVSTNGGGGFQVLQSTASAVSTNYGNSAYPFRIGGGGILDVTGNYFTGLIDEVAVFNRALSAGELSDIFGAALVGGDLPPGISVQPSSSTLYAGRTATFSVSAVGTSPAYRWRKNGLPISDGGNLSGSTNATLTITGVAAGNAGDYDVVITNRVGSVTSIVATLTVITPVPGSYEDTMIGLNPFAYYRLNETSGTIAYDFWGGHNGAYQGAATMGVPGVTNPPFIGFEATNTAVQTYNGTAGSYVTAPLGSLSTNTVTFTAWVYPIGDQASFTGLLMTRGGTEGGFGYTTGNQLGYTWNNNNANTWGYASGLVIPPEQWSFVAVVVMPTNAILYLYNASTASSATNAITHSSDVFGGNWRIGDDATGNPARTFNGVIDEVALFLRSLTPAEVQQLYLAGGLPLPITLNIQQSGADVILTWPQGTLLEANDVTGPWTTNNAASPFTNSPSGAKKFYRVQVR